MDDFENVSQGHSFHVPSLEDVDARVAGFRRASSQNHQVIWAEADRLRLSEKLAIVFGAASSAIWGLGWWLEWEVLRLIALLGFFVALYEWLPQRAFDELSTHNAKVIESLNIVYIELMHARFEISQLEARLSAYKSEDR